MNSRTLNDADLGTAELDLVSGGRPTDIQVVNGASHGARVGADLGAIVAGGSDIGRPFGAAIGAIAGIFGTLFINW